MIESRRPDWRRVYRLADWLMVGLALQGLWILGTLAGLGLLGFGPASTAVAHGWRSVVLDTEGGRWRSFWRVWRREFWRSQGIVLVPALTLWPIVFWSLTTRALPVAVALFVIGCGLLLTLVYLPVAALSGHGVVESWRLGVALAWSRPGPTLGIGLGVAALAVVSVTVSSIVWPLFVPALPLLAAVQAAQRTQAVERDTPV